MAAQTHQSFQPIFTAAQAALGADPAQASAIFSVETRQLGGHHSVALIRAFRMDVDEPAALGGQDKGPNLVKLILAAPGACQEITYRLYADTLGIPLDRVSVSLSGRLDLRGFFAVDEGVRPGFKDISATVRIDSPAPADEIERLRATVNRHCPVLDILRSVTPVKTRIELSAAAQKPAA
jgi:putative redox protein